MPNARILTEWKAHEGSVYGIYFFSNDQRLLSGGYDGDLVHWDVTGRELKRLSTPNTIFHLVADESKNLIVTGHGDGRVRLWELGSLAPIEEKHLHNSSVRAVAFHPETNLVASSGSDGKVFVFSPKSPARQLAEANGDAHDLAFSPDGRYLTGGGWFRLFQWGLAANTVRTLPTEHWGLIRSVQYSRDGKQLATISRQTDSAVYFLDPDDGHVIERFQKHDLCGFAIRLSPNGRFLATTGDDASVRFWDLTQKLPAASYHERHTILN
jgi:WD40 repeat protein